MGMVALEWNSLSLIPLYLAQWHIVCVPNMPVSLSKSMLSYSGQKTRKWFASVLSLYVLWWLFQKKLIGCHSKCMATLMLFPEFQLFEGELWSLSTNQVTTLYSRAHGRETPFGEVNETEERGWDLFTILSLFLYSFVSCSHFWPSGPWVQNHMSLWYSSTLR